MTQLFMVHPQPLADVPPAAPPQGWILRPAVDADGKALAELLSESFDAEWDASRVRSELLDAGDVDVTWVVCGTDGSIRGTASERLLPEVYPDAGYLHFVAVAESARGRGLGRTLTLRCLGGFAARGLRGAVLETDDYRVPAIITYLRLGFVPEYRSEAERVAWAQVLSGLFSTGRRATVTGGASR